MMRTFFFSHVWHSSSLHQSIYESLLLSEPTINSCAEKNQGIKVKVFLSTKTQQINSLFMNWKCAWNLI